MLQCMGGLLFSLWWHIHCYFLFSRYDSGHSRLFGLLVCECHVRGTIFSTVEEEFIVI